MAITDYDAPRRATVDASGDDLDGLPGRRAGRSPGADLGDSGGQGLEPPGGDLPDEELTATVVPMLGDEFRCSRCFLIRHRSQRAARAQGVCRDCA
jgi:hypothetical protein